MIHLIMQIYECRSSGYTTPTRRIASNSAHRQPPSPQRVLTGKGGTERAEESEPGQVEGTHVRLGDAEDFDNLSLVLGVHGQLEESSPVINSGGIEIRYRLPANDQSQNQKCNAVQSEQP